MSGRFRLDPKAPAPERHLPPPPAAPAAKPATFAPPPPPRPAPAAPAKAELARPNRRAIILAATVVALLLVGAVGVYVATALSYPDKYLLEGDEMPAGTSLARMSAEDLRDAGMTENPGEIDWQRSAMADAFSNFGIDEPDEAHGEILLVGSGRIGILAMRYASEDDAKGAAAELRALCSFANGAALRYGDVVVAVFSEDGASRTQQRAVANAVREKAGDPDSTCGV